mgnify:CR=1 FL=1
MLKFAGYTMFVVLVVAKAVGLIVGTVAEATAPFRSASR